MRRHSIVPLTCLLLAVVAGVTAATTAGARARPASPPPATQPARTAAAAAALPDSTSQASTRRSGRQDDLFRHANGLWLANTAIPADRSNYGTFGQLEDEAREAVRRLAEAAAAPPLKLKGTDEQKIGDFYASYMDTDRLAVLGATPLATEVARILAIRSVRDVYVYAGHAQRIGLAHPVMLYVSQDAHDSNAYVASLYQGGLTMPDRDYYLLPDARSVALRGEFRRYVARLLALAGEANADSAALRVTAIEDRIANHHWTRAANRDPVRTYNKVDLAGAARLAPGFDFAALLEGAEAQGVAMLDLNQPTYLAELARLVKSTPVADWKLYFKFHLLDAYAPYLSPQIEQAHFEFHERALRGVPQPPPRWQRGVEALGEAMGEMVGRQYVERNFPPEARTRMLQLVDNLTQAFAQSIDSLDWMSPATKAEARRKLARFTVKIGYPERWRDYSALEIVRGDLAGNVRRTREFEFARRFARLARPVDRDEWMLTPQTVNAYYSPPLNEIVFPAAILRPPLFDPGADDAVNYGAIGAVIGHEISHGFDDQGRQFDGEGNLRDWWTFEDSARFRERAGRLVAQFSSQAVIDGRTLNGQLTLGENIGDLSGLAVAYRAYRISLGAGEAPVIDGYTGPQRFFLGWAQTWRRKYRDDELRLRLVTDPHSPAEFRANGTVANLAEFQEAFALHPGDRLYRPEGERVKIW
ncbi:MAG: M13 family metallopeptidase [Steroidobacteraceae bacterium]